MEPAGPRWVLWGLSAAVGAYPAALWTFAVGVFPSGPALLPLAWLGASLSIPLGGLAWGRAGRFACALLGAAGGTVQWLEPPWLRFP